MTFTVVMLSLVAGTTAAILIALNLLGVATSRTRSISFEQAGVHAADLETALAALRERTAEFHDERAGRTCST